MASTDLKVSLHLMLYEVDGKERFHVHASVEGQTDLVDVTNQYTVTSANNPETGQRGFVVMKKQGDAKP